MTDHAETPDDHFEVDLMVLQRVRAALRHVDDQDVSVADAARAVALSHLEARTRPRQRTRWLSAVAAGVIALIGTGLLLRSDPPEPEPERTAEASAFELRLGDMATFDAVDPGELRTMVADHPPTDASCTLSEGQRSHGVHLLGGRLVEVVTEPSTRVVRLLDAQSCDELQTAVLDD
jgi:hypothetical protein